MTLGQVTKMGRQYWIWVAVALMLSSSVLTTAKFTPHVPHLLDAGEIPASFAHLSSLSAYVVIRVLESRIFLPGSFKQFIDVIILRNSEEIMNDLHFVYLFVQSFCTRNLSVCLSLK